MNNESISKEFHDFIQSFECGFLSQCRQIRPREVTASMRLQFSRSLRGYSFRGNLFLKICHLVNHLPIVRALNTITYRERCEKKNKCFGKKLLQKIKLDTIRKC